MDKAHMCTPGTVHIYILGMKLSSALEDRALIYTTPGLITGRKQVYQADSASGYPFLPNQHSHGPALACGHSEQRQQGPEHIVIVEVVFLPLPRLSFYFFLLVIQILTPENRNTVDKRNESCSVQMHLWIYSQVVLKTNRPFHMERAVSSMIT